MGRWQFVKETLKDGGPGFCQFAVTNACNARCAFCNFSVGRLAVSDRQSVTLKAAYHAIEILARNRIGYLVFVGGEPLVHPNLRAMVRHTRACGLSPIVCTNGSFLTPECVDGLAKEGLSSCIISIDSPSTMVHEKNRGLPGVCQRIREANARFRSLGIQTTASVTASRLIEDYQALPEALRKMGFTSVTFSYPLTSLPSSYLSFSDSRLVAYTTEELLQVFEQIKKVRRRFYVVNPRASLNDMQRHLRGERERFECLAGYKYFYLDWNLDLYRCHYWHEPMCKIDSFDGSKRVRDGCTKCVLDCYRDPSVLQHIAVSVSDAIGEVHRGHLLRAAQIFGQWSNVISAGSVLKSIQWIRGI